MIDTHARNSHHFHEKQPGELATGEHGNSCSGLFMERVKMILETGWSPNRDIFLES